jgi:catechol 2,3-dioxygenase-like lactoylglutathione lyase family enzyme
MSTASTPAGFEGTTPILRVRSLAASIDYYTNVLGFKVEWGQGTSFACVRRDRASLFLCEGDQGNVGSWVWLGVTDVAKLHAEYIAKGASIRHPPTNYEWACEMQVADPDGNVLRCGSDSLPDQPVGEWLDMRGVRWIKLPDGSHARAE